MGCGRDGGSGPQERDKRAKCLTLSQSKGQAPCCIAELIEMSSAPACSPSPQVCKTRATEAPTCAFVAEKRVAQPAFNNPRTSSDVPFVRLSRDCIIRRPVTVPV